MLLVNQPQATFVLFFIVRDDFGNLTLRQLSPHIHIKRDFLKLNSLGN